MDTSRTDEPTLAEELRASALLFGLGLGCTAGAAALVSGTLWLLSR